MKIANISNSRIEDFKRYEIILAKGNKYGIKQSDGSWDGLIGSLLSGEADVCVASLTINQVAAVLDVAGLPPRTQRLRVVVVTKALRF
ncbi:unnamed protein product [Gongylonema pulchrum]|uniref:Lig_chan-Glu_bd domain-containing protein n=1 Tax=Gongylonema pulchrum TaxID=637853 RepID=A0A183DA68_9BILA|nr:unnamed protein product [Gongylonema pulchrum]